MYRLAYSFVTCSGRKASFFHRSRIIIQVCILDFKRKNKTKKFSHKTKTMKGFFTKMGTNLQEKVIIETYYKKMVSGISDMH